MQVKSKNYDFCKLKLYADGILHAFALRPIGTFDERSLEPALPLDVVWHRN